MGHLLRTINPQAAGILDELEKPSVIGPLPSVGTSVQFRLRGGEWRNGSDVFAAIVTRAHPEKGLIDVVVVLGADDTMDQREVPRQTEDSGWGWSPVEGSATAQVEELRTSIAAFKEELAAVLFGIHEKSEESVYDMIVEIDQRIAALEPNVSKAKPKARAKG